MAREDIALMAHLMRRAGRHILQDGDGQLPRPDSGAGEGPSYDLLTEVLQSKLEGV